MGFSIGNLVSKVLPKVAPLIGSITSSPVGKIGLDILKQLAASAFSKDGKAGLFSDKFQLALPNPLSRLNKLLSGIGGKFGSVGEFLKTIGNFLQGKRQLENGKSVTVPPTRERASTMASSAASTSKDITSGKYDSALSRIPAEAFSTGLSPQQNDIIKKAEAAGADKTQLAQMKAQMQMTNMQNMMQFMSNIMRIMGDISKGIVQNIR